MSQAPEGQFCLDWDARGRLHNLGFRVLGFGFRVLGLGFRANGDSRILGLGSGLTGFRFAMDLRLDRRLAGCGL